MEKHSSHSIDRWLQEIPRPVVASHNGGVEHPTEQRTSRDLKRRSCAADGHKFVREDDADAPGIGATAGLPG